MTSDILLWGGQAELMVCPPCLLSKMWEIVG